MRPHWILLATVAVAVACADDVSPAKPAGSEGGPCYGNGTCDSGLQCLSDLCVEIPGPEDVGATPDAQPDDTGERADTPTDMPDVEGDGGPPDARDTSSDVPDGDPADAPEDVPDATEDAPDEGADTGDAGGLTFAEIIPREAFDQMFLHKNDPACEGTLYTYDNLAAAAAAYPAFGATGSADVRRREVAAFLANISHETTGGWPTAPDGPQAWGLCFVQEVGCADGGCVGYCDAGNRDFPCAQGETYHGRGAMQLSWNYNYGLAGRELGEDLLANPDLVATDGRLAFLTAIWFWMRPQAPKPSAHDVMTGGWVPDDADEAAGRLAGFGATINIINGGLECNRPTDGRVEDRVLFYRRYCELLGVDPGPNLYCDEMQPF